MGSYDRRRDLSDWTDNDIMGKLIDSVIDGVTCLAFAVCKVV